MRNKIKEWLDGPLTMRKTLHLGAIVMCIYIAIYLAYWWEEFTEWCEDRLNKIRSVYKLFAEAYNETNEEI